MNHNEVINLYGKKVTVEYVGAHFDRNHVKNDYHLLYDEAEVYHIENAKTKKIIRAFSASSWTEAYQTSLMVIDQIENPQSWSGYKLLSIRYRLNSLMIEIDMSAYLPRSEKDEILRKLTDVEEILSFNVEEMKKEKSK